MPNLTALLSLVSLCGLSLSQPSEPGAPARAVKEGESFPDFALPSLANGRPLSLSSFRGKKVLLLVFASW